jgi:formylglycine-generating enzyme required for sulfatase activity
MRNFRRNRFACEALGFVLLTAGCVSLEEARPPEGVAATEAPPPALSRAGLERAREIATREKRRKKEGGDAARAARFNQMGERAYRRENYAAAERHFRAALKIHSDSLYALTGLAWTLYDSKRPDEAFPVFKKAHSLYPEDGSVTRGLGYLFYRFGERERARAILKTLNKAVWPEIANIEIELAERALHGLPPPRSPGAAPVGKESDRPPAGKTEKPDGKELKARAPKVLKPEKLPEKKTKTPPHPSPARPASRKPSFENMVSVTGGRFAMGGKIPGKKNQNNKETPPPVEVRAFLLDKFEVSNAEYAAFVREKGLPGPPFLARERFAGPHLPVVGVTWHEARAYCAWAGKRLPTEREWEFAARGGEKGRLYPWGDKFIGRNAVFGLSPDRGSPKAVGRHAGGASLHGAEDMAGNAWEWVEDPFRSRLDSPSPYSRKGVVYRTLRGGSWINGRWGLANSSRTGDRPDRRLSVYGFRCAVSLP